MPELTPGVRDPAHRVDLRCDSCGQYDKHPRHLVVLDMARGIFTANHFDCCHYNGCPGAGDESCTLTLAQSGNAHGDDLTAYVEARQRG